MAFLAAPAFTLPVVGGVSWGSVLSGASTLLGGLGSSAQAASDRATAERNAQLAVATAERNRLNAIRTAEINKQNLEQSAGQERAQAQQKALEQAQRQRLLLSRAAAVGAASGAGPMQENIFRGIIGQGEQNKASVMYTGESAAKELEWRGAAGLWQATQQGDVDVNYARQQGDVNVAAARARESGVNTTSLFKGIGTLASLFAPTAMAPGAQAPLGDTGTFGANLSGGYGGGDYGYYSPRYR